MTAVDPLAGLDIQHIPGFLKPEAARHWFECLRRGVNWQQEQFQIFGRRMTSPRLTACAGEAGTSYRYAGTAHQAMGWCWGLAELVQDIREAAGWYPNFVLLNLYRDGQDAMGWHSDDEASLGPEPLIASLSLGETRRFRFRRRDNHRTTFAMQLSDGDLLLMWGRSQRDWQHTLPRTRRAVGPRINLTFRRISS